MRQAVESAGGADAAFLFATPGFEEHPSELVECAAELLGTEALVGASAYGVIGAGQESGQAPAVSVLALRGVEALPFLVPELEGNESGPAEEVDHLLGSNARSDDLVVILPDPRGFDAGSMLASLAEAAGPARIIGAGAADAADEVPQQWAGYESVTGGLAGMVLRGAAPKLGVTQACRPKTEAMTITKIEGHWVQELDGRPALDVYREAAGGPLAADLRRASAFLLAALPRDPSRPLEPGGYLVRNVAGFATDQKAFAVPHALGRGDSLALAMREPETARDDLKAVLADFEGSEPAAGLYFNCCARGAALFGVEGLEAGYLDTALPGTPVVGMLGSCEFGPIGGATELLTYTGVLATVSEP